MEELASQARLDLIFPDLPGPDRDAVLRAIAERFAAAGVVESAEKLYRKLLEREELGSTCVLPGVAIPHCKVEGIDEVVLSVGICREGAEFGTPEEDPVKIFFTVISPSNKPAAHLQSLALISRWIKNSSHVERLLELNTGEEIYAFLTQSKDGAA